MLLIAFKHTFDSSKSGRWGFLPTFPSADSIRSLEGTFGSIFKLEEWEAESTQKAWDDKYMDVYPSGWIIPPSLDARFVVPWDMLANDRRGYELQAFQDLRNEAIRAVDSGQVVTSVDATAITSTAELQRIVDDARKAQSNAVTVPTPAAQVHDVVAAAVPAGSPLVSTMTRTLGTMGGEVVRVPSLGAAARVAEDSAMIAAAATAAPGRGLDISRIVKFVGGAAGAALLWKIFKPIFK